MAPRKEPPQKNSVSWYLRAFAFLLVIWGVIDCVSGGAIVYQAIAESLAAGATLSLASSVLGVVVVAVSGLTAATGVMGLIASRTPARLGSLHTLALAGVVATGLGLGLCSAVGNELPTSLLFNGVLLIICLVVAANAQKQEQPQS